ncbi:MAG: cohesin domain-containing protein [Eubacteriales bacterium]
MKRIKLKHRLMAILMTAMLVFMGIPLTGLTANATTRTADEAISWCDSLVGQALDYDGAYGAQCVDLILAYYNYLGVSTVSGNAIDYTWNSLPSGWTRIQGAQPQKGDILVYTNDTYGHVGIYASETLMYHQAPSLGGYVMRDAHNYNYYPSYWGVIRPNFAAAPEEVSVLTLSGVNYPTYKKTGEPFQVFGTVSSPYCLLFVEAFVRNSSGTVMFWSGLWNIDDNDVIIDSSKKYYNINSQDAKMTFSSLAAGNYEYVIDARDERGYAFNVVFPFTVGSSTTTSKTGYSLVGKHYCDSMAGTPYTWDSGTVTKAATCVDTGIKTYVCRECGATKTETIAATGVHTPGEWTTTVAATCTTAGTKVQKCTVCGATVNTATIAATGHSWNAGVVTKAATCTQSGVMTYTCTTCGATKTETIAATGVHTPGEWTTTVAATCTTAGTKVQKCTVCGTVVNTETIPALGHSYVDTVTPPTTTSDGFTTHVCSRCGDSYIDNIVEKLTDPNGPKIVIDNVSGRAGEEITVEVSLENNPGIINMQLLISYDANILELVSAAEGDFAGLAYGQSVTQNPYAISWSDAIHPNNTTDGVFTVLTFRIKEDAAVGESAITVTYIDDNIFDQDFENVTFATVGGSVSVVRYIPGDVNGDGSVNFKDLGILQQYLNLWSVTVDMDAADVNKDGSVNFKDLGILQQYLNNWDITLK